jgi:hypothetical protein
VPWQPQCLTAAVPGRVADSTGLSAGIGCENEFVDAVTIGHMSEAQFDDTVASMRSMSAEPDSIRRKRCE